MGEPIRVQLRRTKGWRMPPNTVSVARPGRWGNPFIAADLGLERCLDMFRDTLQGFFSPAKCDDLTDDEFHAMYERRSKWLKRIGYHPAEALRSELPGLNLACWCPIISHGAYCPCHADVLLSLANDIPLEEVIRENTRRAEGEAL